MLKAYFQKSYFVVIKDQSRHVTIVKDSLVQAHCVFSLVFSDVDTSVWNEGKRCGFLFLFFRIVPVFGWSHLPVSRCFL